MLIRDLLLVGFLASKRWSTLYGTYSSGFFTVLRLIHNTASGRDSSSNPSWFVINRSDISVASGHSVKSGAYYLGRPWRAYARVVVQNTKLSNVINSAGWTTWNKGDERTSNVYFGEHANTGSGASSKRVGFAKNLRDAVSMESVLGSYQKWADKTWM